MSINIGNSNSNTFVDKSINNNYSKYSQSNYTSTVNLANNDKLYRLTLELAINYDLNLPSKEKDFSTLDEKNIIGNQINYLDINYEDKIDNHKLNEVMKIISKYKN